MRPAPRAARGFFPLDEELALSGGRFSPRLVEGIARLGTEMPFGRAVEILAFFTGVEMGVETARGLVEGAGAALVEVEAAEVEQLERTQEAPPAGAPIQQVSVDGAMVPLLGGEWAEVKTLAVGVIHQERLPDGQWDVRTGELSYFSRLTDAQGFGRLASLELHRRGTDRASTLCAVNDGAEWITKFVTWQCPGAIQILDFPHAAEHVAKAAHAVYGVGTATVSEWLAVQFHQLRHGDPDQVLAALRALPVEQAAVPTEATDVRDGVLAYLEKRRAQIAYPQFSALGYPIGSGCVESANKLVVEARLKRSGMHWERSQVNPMVALRAVACSGRWAERWPHIWRRLRAKDAARRAAGRERRRPTPPPEPEPALPRQVAPRLKQIPLEPKGLIVDGRPSKDHPWRRAPLKP